MKRPISEKGLSLFNIAHIDRSRVQTFLHHMLTSTYDEQLHAVVEKCRDATVALIKLLNDEIVYEMDNHLLSLLNNGIRNATCRVLSHATKRTVQREYIFYTDVMRHAYASGDHQTAMLYYRALSHPAVTRLHLTLPKRMRTIFDTLMQQYTNKEEHVQQFLSIGFSEAFLPSLPILLDYIASDDGGAVKDIADFLSIYGCMYYFINNELIPLYEDSCCETPHDLSYTVKKRDVSEKMWVDNPMFGGI